MDASHPYSNELDKQKATRAKKTERERVRTLTISDAFDKLRENIPINSEQQKKLCQLDTLRMARNYIEALQKMLQTNEQPTPLELANALANGLSPRASGICHEILQAQPHLLNPQCQLDASSVPCSSSQNVPQPDHSPQLHSPPSIPAPSSSSPLPYSYAPNQAHAAPRQATTHMPQYHYI